VNRSFVIVSLITLLVSCKAGQETATSTATTSTTVTQTSATTAAPAVTTTAVTTTVTTTQASVATPAPAGASLASQETNWPGVTAEVTEFKRKGNSLTAKVRLTNKGTADAQPQVEWRDVALVDATGGKKYEVLKDEKGAAIASTRAGWTDRWYESIAPNQSQIIWMKFPAPPLEVKTITLQMPKMPPFDDLTIQD
jgi:hypothetical protein